MGAKVNRVYTALKNILNKQQHGMVTVNEFNSLAEAAQRAVADDLIASFIAHEKNKLRNYDPIGAGGVQSVIDDLSPLMKTATLASSGGNNIFQKPSDFMYWVQLYYDGSPISDLSPKMSALVNNSSNLSGRSCGVNSVQRGGDIYIYPDTITSDVTLDYYKIPQGVTAAGVPTTQPPTWAYTTVSNVSIYNATNSIDFELPESCEDRILWKIVSYVAPNLRDFEIYNVSQQMEGKEISEQQ